ncbi:MAG: hypothetical protein ONB31_00975 [candidate division KSB1 bacterium]|nr:hypothetical protein [candidate division KSB1 bacterium]MDZ7334886.1 hypothetical protein [candidate division KSB1 bacterium]MDZ7357336.1 hypothetical protein [candidate division KSB1 bacterium]MDZ7399342.1 hypothetical protein [candidate division KSB1 bacterium]
MKKYILLFAIVGTLNCAANRIQFEQFSVSLNLPVAPDSSVTIGSDEQFFGVLWLAEIIKAEQVQPEKIKLIQNYGRYFICADGFKHVWMIEPQRDGMSAKFKAIDVTPKDKTDDYRQIGLSRYGTRDHACVKFRFNQHEIFIDRKGNIHEKCGK